MKTINETFTDEEHKKLKKAKKENKKKNWHDFILTLIQKKREDNKK